MTSAIRVPWGFTPGADGIIEASHIYICAFLSFPKELASELLFSQSYWRE